MKFFTLIICAFSLAVLSTSALANVKPNTLFSDHMVLQQGASVPIWGIADDGETITVDFNGQSVSTQTIDGKWLVRLKPMAYSNSPLTMTITGKNTVQIHDVLIGEVWLCAGQSNMERQLGPRPPQVPLINWEAERDAANYPLIREYYVPLQYASEKVQDAKSKWTVCSPQTVSEFSAVGYFFAKNLFTKLQIPVAIIFSAFGGTPAEDWTSKAALEANPGLKEFVSNYKQIVAKDYQPAGQRMSGLYNGMVYPLIPYAIKGVAWYQGESNNSRADQYTMVLSNMIQNWRKDFGQGNFPFLIVQVAPHNDLSPELRQAQSDVVKTVVNTALIVTTDCGDAIDLHPPNKQPIGERLALAARALAYKDKIEYSGPQLKSYSIKGNKIILRFEHVSKGLKAAGTGQLKGFTISNDKNKYVDATAIIIGKNKIVVYREGLEKPTVVRYGWANVPNVNLSNSSDLPASPFRTDRK